jgi:hypothetical protein
MQRSPKKRGERDTEDFLDLTHCQSPWSNIATRIVTDWRHNRADRITATGKEETGTVIWY